MTQKIKIGIIGTGAGMRTHFPAFINLNTEIIGIVGNNFEKTQKIALENGIKAYKNFKEICDNEDIDLIIIATPNNLHYEQIKYAISKNKHILAEKPLVLSEKENIELLSLIKEKKEDRLYLVNHQLRFNTYINTIKQIIKSNKLGYIYHVNIHQQSSAFSKKNIQESWSFDKNSGGGVRLAMGSHLIDLVSFLFDSQKITTVFANTQTVINQRKNKTYHKNSNTSSFFNANLSLEDNLNVNILTNAAAIGKAKFQISIFGSDGEVHFDLENKLKMKLIDEPEFKNVVVDNVSQEELTNKISIFRSSFKMFAPLIVDAISNKNTIEKAASFQQALYIFKILEAAKESSTKNKSIPIT